MSFATSIPAGDCPPEIDDWAALAVELDRWADAGAEATFWWRDDDAATPNDALERLLGVAGRFGVPVSLAVVPAHVTSALADMLAGRDFVEVLQHGWSHANHASGDDRQCELDDQRWPLAAKGELQEGWRRLHALFGPRAQRVQVPPWNRIGPAAVGWVRETGFRAISGLGPAPANSGSGTEVAWLNVHVDIMNWGSRRFAGDGPVLDQALGHLRGRRTGVHGADRATGIMTHHWAHDSQCWDFLDRFLTVTSGHPAARWVTTSELLGAAG